MDRILAPVIIAFLLVFLAVWEWWRYLTDQPYSPQLLTVLAIGGVLYASWQAWRSYPRLRALRQGRDGERAVGQYLERLRQQGYQVFHDVFGENFNVDHVLIGPAGIFSVETKTISKPVRGDPRVYFDGKVLRVGRYVPQRDPVTQAKAQARWLKELLREENEQAFDVCPLILFPGWDVKQAPGSTREVCVLEPKALPRFLSEKEPVLTESQIQLAANRLSRYVRANR